MSQPLPFDLTSDTNPTNAMSLHDFSIVETTLREGEQFCKARFSSSDKVEIAKALDSFGVEYIELTSPRVSIYSRKDCHQIAELGLKSKVLTHIRCNLEDAKVAVDTGVDGINIVIGTSDLLRYFSHGKSIEEIIEIASKVLGFIRQANPRIELRFSTEDSFRSSLSDLLRVYLEIDRLGLVDRFGIADTVGIATPSQVFELVKILRQTTQKDIEFHGHNDTGCAIANSYTALEAGATHINTTVLGIGERNGITPLEGLVARLYVLNPEAIERKYALGSLGSICKLVADKVGVEIPFDRCIVGSASFSHKAGIHTKAVLKNSRTYEIIAPEDFGLERTMLIDHPLTGKYAISHRCHQLGLNLSPDKLVVATQKIKDLAYTRQISLEGIDRILVEFSQS
ncbi:MAG: homocitrate synthase [Baaleninema sp.]